ncbi:dienelactone hydrolase family protein [Pseudorhodoferax sp.]|uniref:dienelactone hydrolase family protein n=1 Tax=Pseudorhodoferax sp. TaxID=1993553 RepID=UPI0039E563E2
MARTTLPPGDEDAGAGPVRTRWMPIGPEPRHEGYLALPPAGRGPGLLLYQEIVGVNSHIRALARLWALHGFTVLAPDVFWRQARRVQLDYAGAGRERGMAMMHALQPAEMQADAQAAVAALRALPEVAGGRVGTMGFCLGGLLAYVACAATDVDAGIAYYGGGIDDRLALAAAIRAPMQFHYAGRDVHIPPQAVDRIRAAMGPRADVFVYQDAPHGFNCWERSAYHPASAALAHGRSLAFLAGKLFGTA